MNMTKIALALTIVGTATFSSLPADASPILLVKSIRAIDVAKHTVTLPVHKGTAGGKTVWYILTDTSDAAQAAKQGLVFAPLLANTGVAMNVAAHGGVWNFPFAPNFSPDRTFTPGQAGFPPKAAAPGATAPAGYSPFVKVAGSPAIYNAPIVATGDGSFDVTTHRNTSDRVLALDPKAGTVTLLLADGFAEGKRVFYISTEASDPGAATLERATYAPGIGKANASARLKIVVIVNGEDQGLAFAALKGNLNANATAANSATLRTSGNVLGGLPSATATGGIYDPLWNVEIGAWTAAAVGAKKNVLFTSASAVAKAVEAKSLTGPGGVTFGPPGFAVNCPVLAIGDDVTK
jgi:hypothetical protein